MTEIRADMVGLVYRILVSEGQQVAAGEQILLLEAMKMEMAVGAPVAGTVSKILVREGDAVQPGDLLLELDAG